MNERNEREKEWTRNNRMEEFDKVEFSLTQWICLWFHMRSIRVCVSAWVCECLLVRVRVIEKHRASKMRDGRKSRKFYISHNISKNWIFIGNLHFRFSTSHFFHTPLHFCIFVRFFSIHFTFGFFVYFHFNIISHFNYNQSTSKEADVGNTTDQHIFYFPHDSLVRTRSALMCTIFVFIQSNRRFFIIATLLHFSALRLMSRRSSAVLKRTQQF